MKTNVPIELTDDQRSHIANLIDRKQTKRKATRSEISTLAASFFIRLLDGNVGDSNQVSKATDGVIHDINSGAWSMVGHDE
jgi:hypothetical protein